MNCIDSLDRTNTMQQLMGRSVLEKQFKALDIIQEDESLNDLPTVAEKFR